MSTKYVNFFHMNVSITKRSDGHSAVEGASYILREDFVDLRTGIKYDFRNAHQYEYVIETGTVLCQGAPKEWENPEVLWNAAEAYSDAKNAQTARRVELSFPNQLSDKTVIELTKRMAQYYADQGMCVTWAIHNNVDKSHPNKHAHFNLTKQPVVNGKFAPISQSAYWVRNEQGVEFLKTAQELKDAKNKGEIWEKVFYYADREGGTIRLTDSEAAAEGYTKKDRIGYDPCKEKKRLVDWDDRDTLKRWRSDMCCFINEALEKECVTDEHGKQWKVDHRSYKDQGVNKIPTRHRGFKVSAIEARAAAKAEEQNVVYQPVTDRAQMNMYTMLTNYIMFQNAKRVKEENLKAKRVTKAKNKAANKMADKMLKEVVKEVVRKDKEEDKKKDSLHQAVFGD